MRLSELLQEVRMTRFEEMYGSYQGGMSQEDAALALGVCARTFRRYIEEYEEYGLEGLLDKRLTQESHRRAPVDEVMAVVNNYKRNHEGWNALHFYSWYQRAGGQRSYSWVKNTLQSEKLIPKKSKKGKHRQHREPSPFPGMILFQDGSTHEWVPDKQWDLIVTMDDATSEHYSMFFTYQEGTASSFQGVREVILQHGLFSSIYTDRGSHYWHTPKEGGKVSKTQLTQFGRALKQLGIEMIASYSPEGRGRIERVFATHQDRLVKELAYYEITDMDAANRYLAETYLPAYNAEFMRPAREEGSAFVPWVGADIDDILCEHHERVVTGDNCVSFEGKLLQIPANRHRYHYVKVRVRVHRHADGSLAIFHGPRKLAAYAADGAS